MLKLQNIKVSRFAEEGDSNARANEGTHRYLPKKAWEQMDEKEQIATDEKKLEGSKAGEQYVPNTGKAKRARKGVSEKADDKDNDVQKPQSKKLKGNMKKDVADGKKSESSPGRKPNKRADKQEVGTEEKEKEKEEEGEKEVEEEQEDDEEEEEDNEEEEAGEGEISQENENDAESTEHEADTDLDDANGDEEFVPER